MLASVAGADRVSCSLLGGVSFLASMRLPGMLGACMPACWLPWRREVFMSPAITRVFREGSGEPFPASVGAQDSLFVRLKLGYFDLSAASLLKHSRTGEYFS